MKLHRWSDISARSRAKPGAAEAIELNKRELRGQVRLAELRRARDFTQTRLAEVMHKTQPEISRIENEADLYVSTLRSYVEAMGGELEIAAVFNGERVPIAAFGRIDEIPSSPNPPREAD